MKKILIATIAVIAIATQGMAQQYIDVYQGKDVVGSMYTADIDSVNITGSSDYRHINFWTSGQLINSYIVTSIDSIKVYRSENEPWTYMGIIGFNQELYTLPIGILSSSTESRYTSFLNNLSRKDGTLLYYGIENAINMLSKYKFPAPLSSVNIITFTDGLDQGSLMMSSGYSTDAEYLSAINNRFKTTKVRGVPITAYSLGLRGSDVTNYVQFQANLQQLSSSEDKAFEANNMADIRQHLLEISNRIISTSNKQAISVKIPGQSNGTRVCFTFDGNSPAYSTMYIEGTFDLANRTLRDVSYHGIRGNNGITMSGVQNGIFVTYTFSDLQRSDGNGLVPSEYIRQYNQAPGSETWQINTEFTPENNTQTFITNSGTAIMLVLDCSSSLGSQFANILSYARDFISQIVNNAEPYNIEAPTNVKATPDEANFEVVVSWDAVKHADSYTVYRSNDPSTDFTIVAEGITSNTWTDRISTNWAERYFYKVVAVGGGVNSTLSERSNAIICEGSYVKYWNYDDLPYVNADTSDPTWDNGSKFYCYDHKGHKTERKLDFIVEHFASSDEADPQVASYAIGYRLAHTPKGDTDVKINGQSQSYTGIVNTTVAFDPTSNHEAITCKNCPITPANRHLFTDADETVYGLDDQIKTLQGQNLIAALGAEVSTTTAQDVVVWNGTINLSKLVELHLLGNDTGAEKVVTFNEMKKRGLDIRFELTGIFSSGNSTSESAYAAINQNETGDYILRPQLPVMKYQVDGGNKGVSAPWGATSQDRSTIGHTPLVRVLLVDTIHNDHVVDYGYIRLVIVDDGLPFTIEYETGFSADYEWSSCNIPSGNPQSWMFSFGTIENDINNMFSLSQADFEAKYTAEFFEAPELKQYEVKLVDGKYQPTGKEIAAANYIGKIQIREGADVGSANTDRLVWSITADEMTAIGMAGGIKNPTRAIKFTYKGTPTIQKDIFVILKAGEFKSTKVADQYPTVVGQFDANKIKEYWYDENTQITGKKLHEAHITIPKPEAGEESWIDSRTCPFEYQISSLFQSSNIMNEYNIAQYITVIDPTPNHLYAINKAEKSFGFVVLSAEKDGYKANNKAKGRSGKTYTIYTRDYNGQQNWALWARSGSINELIAYLAYDESGMNTINHIKIVLNKDAHRTDFINSAIEDLLNYKGNNELNDDVLKAVIGFNFRWNNNCPYEAIIPAFQFRFIRPINISFEDRTLTNAAYTRKTISLYDLVQPTDWCNQWNPTETDEINKEKRDYRLVPSANGWIVDYWYYYNIKRIVIGNADEIIEPSSMAPLNNFVYTNMNGNDINSTILGTVTGTVEFTYIPPGDSSSAEIGDKDFYGNIEFANLTGNVAEFDVRIPIAVCYEWGTIYQYVTIHVSK